MIYISITLIGSTHLLPKTGQVESGAEKALKMRDSIQLNTHLLRPCGTEIGVWSCSKRTHRNKSDTALDLKEFLV